MLELAVFGKLLGLRVGTGQAKCFFFLIGESLICSFVNSVDFFASRHSRRMKGKDVCIQCALVLPAIHLVL